MQKSAIKIDIDSVTPQHAMAALKILVKEDEMVAARLKKILEALINAVDPDDVSEEVYAELNCIEVEDLWDRSGSRRDGYVDPSEMAVEMVEETVDPFLERLKEYQSLSMPREAILFCMGILKGLYKFDKESVTPFREWAEDVAGGVFGCLLTDFKKSYKDKQLLNDLEHYIQVNCPLWHLVS